MKYETEIVSEWERVKSHGRGTVTAPLADRLFQIQSWSDTTGQDRSAIAVGRLIVLRSIVEKTELDKIRAHPQHHCLWCRPVAGTDRNAELPDAEIPRTEEQALHTFLTGQGTTLSDRTLAVGPRTAGRTRRNVARRLKAWLRTLKKAVPTTAIR